MWERPCVGLSMRGHVDGWACLCVRTYVWECLHRDTSVCGHLSVWVGRCFGTSMCAYVDVWTHLCVGRSMFGYVLFIWPMCVLPSLPRHRLQQDSRPPGVARTQRRNRASGHEHLWRRAGHTPHSSSPSSKVLCYSVTSLFFYFFIFLDCFNVGSNTVSQFYVCHCVPKKKCQTVSVCV